MPRKQLSFCSLVGPVVPLKERIAWQFISTDNQGSRYDPLPDTSEIPFEVLLQPNEAVKTTRAYIVTPNVQLTGLVIAHEGPFSMDWFIIGHGPFQKQPMVRLNDHATY